ncbi:MAG: response regulator transcription factor [Fusobacteria bacterium]|nr:response regulator transcription factor [Fusobacteriota bacterium]
MSNKRILVVEDDKDIQELVEEILKAEGYVVFTAANGLEGYELFKTNQVDLIILDVMMPKMDGYQMAKLVRQRDEKVPIIMLTALEGEYDEIKGFEIGVDDYITKPFSFNILIKRVKAIIRRNEKEEAKSLEFKEISLDVASFKAQVNDKEIELTYKEFEIIHLLMKNKNKVISRQSILDEIWGKEYKGDTRVLDSHIKNLRKKLNIPYIKTLKGIGYKFEA